MAMVPIGRVIELLSIHGTVRSQPASDYAGHVPLPASVAQFYDEIGPVDITIPSYGNPFFLPRLSALWEFQAGYRWNGLTGTPIDDWNRDWLVVADEGGDPFIFDSSSGSILHDIHGRGVWEPQVIFPNLRTMAACLAQLGAVVTSAGHHFTDEDSWVRQHHLTRAASELADTLESDLIAKSVLSTLGWTSGNEFLAHDS